MTKTISTRECPAGFAAVFICANSVFWYNKYPENWGSVEHTNNSWCVSWNREKKGIRSFLDLPVLHHKVQRSVLVFDLHVWLKLHQSADSIWSNLINELETTKIRSNCKPPSEAYQRTSLKLVDACSWEIWNYPLVSAQLQCIHYHGGKKYFSTMAITLTGQH